MTEYQFWSVFCCGFIGGMSAMMVIFAFLRDKPKHHGDTDGR